MRVLWINPSFLDYRVAVYRQLDELLDGGLTVVYSKARVPQRVIQKVEQALGERAIGLTGERRFEFGRRREQWANAFVRIPLQPGLLKTIMRIETDVILAEGFFQWTPGALAKSLWQRTPLAVVYERTHHTERNCPAWRSAYRRLLMPRIDAMLCSGSECRDYAQSLGMPAARIACGHMAADTTGLAAKAAAVSASERGALRSAWNAEGLVFLVVGRLIELKGLRELLRAWERFERHAVNAVTLVIAGDGPLRKDLEAFTLQHLLRGVRFLGEVDHDSLAPVYAAADVLVLPTLEDNWALVVPEAMACGVPVLCSRYNGGARDLIAPGRNGWVFDPLDQKDFHESLLNCLHASGELTGMRSAAAHTAEQHTPHHAALSIVEGCKLALRHRQRNRAPSPAKVAEKC